MFHEDRSDLASAVKSRLSVRQCGELLQLLTSFVWPDPQPGRCHACQSWTDSCAYACTLLASVDSSCPWTVPWSRLRFQHSLSLSLPSLSQAPSPLSPPSCLPPSTCRGSLSLPPSAPHHYLQSLAGRFPLRLKPLRRSGTFIVSRGRHTYPPGLLTQTNSKF